jgi:hypothetical protein
MMIRQDFERLPPKSFLMQILDSVSKTYVFLWDLKDPDDQLDLSWDFIKLHYQKNNFRTSLRKLNNIGLLSYVENAEGFKIELVGFNDLSD